MRRCPIETHPWDLAPSEAMRLQERLAAKVIIGPLPDKPPIRFIAAVDVAFPRRSYGCAAAVVYDIQQDQPVEQAIASGAVKMPYIPGLLSFRECPLALEALERVQSGVSVVLADGQGIAHPRGLGFASHLGLWLGIPTIGCAKSLLCGRPLKEPAPEAGAWMPLIYRNRQVGITYRTRSRVQPVHLSPGHLVDFDGILHLMRLLPARYRLPEPSRLAHIAASQAAGSAI